MTLSSKIKNNSCLQRTQKKEKNQIVVTFFIPLIFMRVNKSKMLKDSYVVISQNQ